MPITITTRVEDAVVRDIDRVAKLEAMDRSTVIRRFLVHSVQEWRIEQALKEYEQGKITLWQAARKSDISLWAMIEEVKKRTVHVPYTLESLKEDIEAL